MRHAEAHDGTVAGRGTARGAEQPDSVVSRARTALYENGPYVFLIGAYVLASMLILPWYGRRIPYTLGQTLPTPAILLAFYLAVTFLVAIVVDVFAARRPPFSLDTWRGMIRRRLGIRRIVGAVIVVLTLPVLLNAMAGFRLALTDIKPFTYDELFMVWDRVLHLGRHPWEWLQPLIGHPEITRFIDLGYLNGWILMMWGCNLWQAVHGKEPLRLQYFLSFAACWILLGSLAAVLLSSAGPVYYGRVTGLADPYLPLIDYLNSVDAVTPLVAVEHHEQLWLRYRTWGGITAMPSMHIAITTIVALVLIRHRAWLAVVAVPLWLFMMIASVHLGWHYAIDGYASAIGAGSIWYLSGRISRWWLSRRPGLLPDSKARTGAGQATHAV